MDLEHAVEGTLAKAVSTFVVPALITAVGILGGVLLTDMRSTLQRQGLEMQDMREDMRYLQATLDGGMVWRLNEIERRLGAVEEKLPNVGGGR
jgi:hypothetical protein